MWCQQTSPDPQQHSLSSTQHEQHSHAFTRIHTVHPCTGVHNYAVAVGRFGIEASFIRQGFVTLALTPQPSGPSKPDEVPQLPSPLCRAARSLASLHAFHIVSVKKRWCALGEAGLVCQ